LQQPQPAPPADLPTPWRQRIHTLFDDPTTAPEQAINGAIAALIVLSAAVFVVETYPLSAATLGLLGWVDRGIVALFGLEYGLRLVSAQSPWRYALSPLGLVDLVAIVPSLLGFLDLRFLRLLRWLRLLRLLRLFQRGQLFGAVTGADGLVFTRIVLGLGTTIFIYAGLIFQVEHSHNPDTFATFFDALYFAIVTMTTVGFGDMTPTSDSGRALTVLMILTGIALIPTLVGNFMRQMSKVTSARQQPCGQCGLNGHDVDARFCKRCGTALPPTSPEP